MSPVMAGAEHDIAAYQREVEVARQAGAGHELDETFGGTHLLRERIDGATGA